MGLTAVALYRTLWQSSLARSLDDFFVAYLSTEIAAFSMLSGRSGGSMARVLTSECVRIFPNVHVYFLFHLPLYLIIITFLCRWKAAGI